MDVYCMDVYCMDVYCMDVYCMDVYFMDVYFMDVYCMDVYFMDVYFMDILHGRRTWGDMFTLQPYVTIMQNSTNLSSKNINQALEPVQNGPNRIPSFKGCLSTSSLYAQPLIRHE